MCPVIDAKMCRYIGESISRLGELQPRPPDHSRRIEPSAFASDQIVTVTCPRKGKAVERRMGHNNSVLQSRGDQWEYTCPRRSIFNLILIDPVNGYIDRTEIVLRVYK